jgi:ATP diphosphatase
VRRHPHVFDQSGRLTSSQQTLRWEEIKAEERKARERRVDPDRRKPDSHLDGIPRALPALMRAFKISKRAARVGFDFEHPAQTADKVQEELDEVRAEAAEASLDARRVFEEVGDLLFAAANLARKLDVDAEAALRAANDKFERRFRGMEALAAERGETFAQLSLEAQERLWEEVKRAE